MMDFDVGNVVSLKSGGPPMTVSVAEPGKQEVKCVWFDPSGCIHEYLFGRDALVLHEGSDGVPEPNEQTPPQGSPDDDNPPF